jgi:HD-GYP domain-containing protein (c-di-GMP phosphodiesterase class II)
MPEDQKAAHNEGRTSFFIQQQLVSRAKKAFLQLVALFKNATIYPAAHPFLLGSAEQVLISLDDLFTRKSEAAYHIIAGELYFETFSIPLEEQLSLAVENISGKGIGGMTFFQGLKRDELVAFAYLQARLASTPTGQSDRGGLLSQAGITRIKLHNVIPGSTQTRTRGGGEKTASEIYLDGVDVVKEIIHSAQMGKTINVRKMHSLIHDVVDNVLDNRDALVGLSSIKFYDAYTFAHSLNVAILSTALGSYLSFEKTQIASLGIAGLLHDIGKVNIPLAIINKPDFLNDSEWEIVKRHPMEGALILSGLPGVGRSALVTAFEHHQHFDLQGYPQAAGEGGVVPVHPFSRIVAIADAYDALTSLRIYFKIPRPPDEAVKILLSKRGTAFDPVLVKAFVNMVGIFPIGTLLRLNTGETGLVIRQTRDLLRPRVLLLTIFDGSEKDEVSLVEMDGGGYKRSAIGTIDPNLLKVDVSRYFK